MTNERSADLSTNSRVKPKRRASWTRTIIAWHWISSAISLVGMLLFAITGITLNHASQIESKPVTETFTTELPQELQTLISTQKHEGTAALHDDVTSWLRVQFSRSIGARNVEWSEHEVYVSIPGPGSDAWLAIDLESGNVEYEQTRRGWVSYLNDLHKGRNTGETWKWFLDLFAVATLVFCLTGLLLLAKHAKRRHMTWPLVALGLVAPLLVVILLIH
ncbi:PepSY-associated TM helix [Planctomycetes bacterium CA13]|uniref:PepSY-associated TM helix n=1 Tax=Novipirellula herctigrandis TaxID=2527986 RepID=A0A5C5YVZ9_9BACT|nr:PepSY-associated TM helix [Planctomycetes bacterium CA13]